LNSEGLADPVQHPFLTGGPKGDEFVNRHDSFQFTAGCCISADLTTAGDAFEAANSSATLVQWESIVRQVLKPVFIER
jgi:hypothetical protein